MRKTFVKLFVAAALVIAGAFNANAQMGGGFQMDPDGIAKMIVDDMNQTVKLTDDQQKKVLELYTAQMKDMEKQFSSGQMPDMDAMQKQQEEQKRENSPEQKAKEEREEKQKEAVTREATGLIAGVVAAGMASDIAQEERSRGFHR